GKGRPYDDEIGADDVIRYRYRGTDPYHRDNVGLREAMHERVPLIYLHGVERGQYVAAWPVFVVGDDPATLTFNVRVDVRAPASGDVNPGALGQVFEGLDAGLGPDFVVVAG